MAKRGRPPGVHRTKVSFRIRTDLLAELDLLMLDPMRDKVKYSARNTYIEELIEKDFERLRRTSQGLPSERPVDVPLEKE